MVLHRTNSKPDHRIRQGDIFPKVRFIESYRETAGQFELTMFEFPHVIILTQDCDLEQLVTARQLNNVDDKLAVNDKHLISVIAAPLYNSEILFAGNHLSDIGIKTQVINSKLKAPIQNNQNPRYHYLRFAEEVPIPNSVIDFKHYFTISIQILEERISDRICGIDPLYRELVSQRFASYLARIGLPSLDDN
jgi:hypothetical protein